MFQSICVYGFMSIAFFLLLQTTTKRMCNGQMCVQTIPLFRCRFCIALLIFAFFSGVRWDVGIDHLSYLSEYLSLQKNGFTRREDFEVGYIAFQKLLVSLQMPFFVYFGLIAALQIFLASTYFKDQRYLLAFYWVLIMLGGDFFSWMNGMRQALAGAGLLCVLALTLEKKQWFVFCVCAYGLSFIHKSAILMMPLCLLFYVKLEKIMINRYAQFAVYFSALAVSSMSVWTNLIGLVDTLFQFIGFGERFNSNLLENLEARTMTFGGRRILFMLVDLILITYSPILRKAYPTRKFGFAYLMFIVYYVLQPLFITSLVFSRIVNYFYPFRSIVCAYLLYYLFRIRRTANSIFCGVVIFTIVCLYMLVSLYLDEGGHTSCMRYMFFWNHFNTFIAL